MKKMILLGFISTLIFSSEVFGKDTILMKNCSTDSVSGPALQDYRNTLFRSLVTLGSQQYTIVESGTRVDYLKEVHLEQQVRDEGRLDLAKVLLPKFILDCSIRKSGNKYSVWMQMNSSGAAERIVEKKGIFDFQMDYYLNEIAQAVLNSSYKINESGAPATADFSISYSSMEPMAIPKIEFSTKDDRGNQFIETVRPILQEGDNLYSKKSYKEAAEIYKTILSSIRKNLGTETQQILQGYTKDIKNRMLAAYLNFVYTGGEIQDVQENLEPYTVAEIYAIREIGQEEKKIAEVNALVNKSDFEGALMTLQRISYYYKDTDTFHISGKDIPKSSFPALVAHRKKVKSFENSLTAVSQNKWNATVEILERAVAYYEILKSTGKEDSPEAVNAILIFQKNFDIIEKGQFNGIASSLKYSTNKKFNDTGMTYKYLDLASKEKKNSEERYLRHRYKTKTEENNVFSYISFPFKYIANVTLVFWIRSK